MHKFQKLNLHKILMLNKKYVILSSIHDSLQIIISERLFVLGIIYI